MKAKNIGIGVEKPEKECNDINCPFHGKLKTRGRIFVGEVISSKMHKTITIQFERSHQLPKYDRYEKRKSKIKAHNPECISAKEGDLVKIMETRPLSKTKKFVVIEKIRKIKGFKDKRRALEQSKVREEKEPEKEDSGEKE